MAVVLKGITFYIVSIFLILIWFKVSLYAITMTAVPPLGC